MHHFTLFQLAKGQSAADKIQALQPTDLNRLFGAAILGRGKSYHDRGQIEEVDFQAGKITATVFGQKLYEVIISRAEEEVKGYCDCPYGGLCKHLAALLLHLIHDAAPADLEVLDRAEATGPEDQHFEAYLDAMSKNELKQLIREFAPDSFRHTILMKFAGTATKEKEFLAVKKGIQNLFKRDLYEIASFETELTSLTERLKALWATQPDEIGALLVYIVEQVGESFEEGYLYDDYSDHAYEGEAFGSYLAEFVAALPLKSRKIWLLNIWQVINGLGYSTFENFFTELNDRIPGSELNQFKELILENDLLSDLAERDRKNVYQRIAPVLNTQEKKELLKDLSYSSNYFTLQLADYYESRGLIKQAVELLDDKLSQKSKSRSFYYAPDQDLLFEKRIQMEEAYRDGELTLALTKAFLESVPTTKSLRFSKQLLPDQIRDFEKILEKERPGQLVDYLEEEERLPEIPPLFKKYPDQLHLSFVQYPFYQRHKKRFPGLALPVFERMLAEELPHTGDRHYYKVAEILSEIKAVKPKKEFEQQLADIKGTYSRRRNLLGILGQAGL